MDLTPFTTVPYFWSDQYDVRIQAYGHLRVHDDAVIVTATSRPAGSSSPTAARTA